VCDLAYKKSKGEQKGERALRVQKSQLSGAAKEELVVLKYKVTGHLVDKKHPKGGDMAVRKDCEGKGWEKKDN
jgi:hypothetical protein